MPGQNTESIARPVLFFATQAGEEARGFIASLVKEINELELTGRRRDGAHIR